MRLHHLAWDMGLYPAVSQSVGVKTQTQRTVALDDLIPAVLLISHVISGKSSIFALVSLLVKLEEQNVLHVMRLL